MERETESLRRQFNNLLAMARDNEEKQRRFNELELRLIAATSLTELVERLLVVLPASFGLDYVTLALADPAQELALLCRQRGLVLEDHPGLQFTPGHPDLPCATGAAAPWLGPFAVREHTSLFPDLKRRPASIALLPLVRGADVIGSLNLGSLDPHRYAKGGSTDFLARLAAITAVSIENCFNHERLRQLGFTDALTGVNNRRYFEERLAEEFAAARRRQQPLACMFLDVDHFKRFNDAHGHQAGDAALREVACVVRAQLRRSDTLGRYGGEEFVVLMPGATREAAQECAERIRAAVQGHALAVTGDAPVHVTVSIGVAVLTAHEGVTPLTAAELVRAADAAVYRAKSAGRDRVVVARTESSNP